MGYIQVQTTIPSHIDAQTIANLLIEKRLAAGCSIIGPIRSTYRWKGNIEQSEEWICTIKTRADLYPQVEQTIQEVHPYEVPEIVSFDLLAGNAPYLQWINTETRP